LLVFVSLVGAVTEEDAAPKLHTKQRISSKNGTGSFFRNHRMYGGFTLGAGFGTKVFNGKCEHDLALISIQGGLLFTDVIFGQSWFRGNLELAFDLYGGAQFNPNNRYVFGFAPSVRYNFATDSRWLPLIDGGLGIAYTDIGPPGLSTRFEFIVQAGADTSYYFRQNIALVQQYRWFHMSNADIKEPNHGTNTQIFMAGVNWFF
jgi:hypothetical protein